MKIEKIEITNNKEYTFNKFLNNTFQKQSAIQSIFNGSIIKNSQMLNSDFSKSDFEGTIWDSVYVEDCKFKSCDIKSSIISNCTFINCDFSLNAISDTEFSNCEFDNCLFDETLISQNIFKNCYLKKVSFAMATITLSKFYDCIIENVILGNCSFYDHIMINCQYSNVTINIDSIGRIYGLTIDNIQNFKYIFLGITYGFVPEHFFQHIDHVFASKEWRISKALYLFNMGKISAYEFIKDIFTSLVFFIKNNIIVKRDDLIFITSILSQIKDESHLPLFSLYEGIEMLNENIELLINNKYYNKFENFREFLNNIFFIFNEAMMCFSELNIGNMKLISCKTQYILELHYENEQIINFHKMLNQFLKYNGYDESYYSKLVETKNGSIIEVIFLGVVAVHALQFLLYGVNGILLQIADMTTKIQVIKTEKYRKDLLENTISGKQLQPEIVQTTFKLLKDKEFNKTLCAFASTIDVAKIIDANIKNVLDSK